MPLVAPVTRIVAPAPVPEATAGSYRCRLGAGTGLAGPRDATVVTHGGHGTVVRALAADVPLVVLLDAMVVR